MVELWGGGGGGSAQYDYNGESGDCLYYQGGTGAYAKGFVQVTPGTSYSVTVGGGGSSGYNAVAGGGGSSVFGGLSAAGGGGGGLAEGSYGADGPATVGANIISYAGGSTDWPVVPGVGWGGVPTSCHAGAAGEPGLVAIYW